LFVPFDQPLRLASNRNQLRFSAASTKFSRPATRYGYFGDSDRYVDRDRDGVPNRYDRDRDNDGVPNYADRRPNNPNRD